MTDFAFGAKRAGRRASGLATAAARASSWSIEASASEPKPRPDCARKRLRVGRIEEGIMMGEEVE
jgi:hypothetical protein